MFTSKPLARQINLDLAEMTGGGSCPSQFWGTTSDGQDVFIHYRGGTLSIDVAGLVIYKERIGPYLHGDILIEQISELVGVTVNGQRLSLSAEEFASRAKDANLRDFSGRTLYWDRWVHSSAVGMDLFVDRIKEVFPSAALFDERWLAPLYDRVQINWRQTASHCFGTIGSYAYLVLPPSSQEQQRPQIFESRAAYDKFWATVPHYVALQCLWNAASSGDRKYSTRHQELYDKDFIFAGNQGVIRSQFDVNDLDSRRFLESVEQIFERTFSNEVEIVNLDTETRVNDERYDFHYSIDLIEWCRKSSRRFLGLRVEAGGGKTLGWRPRTKMRPSSSR